jgi:hypothetical protein
MRDSVRQTLKEDRLGANIFAVDFGKEKRVTLKGLDDKAIEQQVTDLVQSKI